MQEPQRIQKLIAESGYCSRRKAEQLIEEGKVTVNNKVVTLGNKATKRDKIRINNRLLHFQEKAYLLFNKPKGYLCTQEDPKGRKTIFDLLPKIKGLKYAGRLDKDTEGLLILSNDGDFIQSVAHPSSNILKTYKVVIDKPIKDHDLKKLNKRIKVDNDVIKNITTKAVTNNTLQIQLHSGQNRIIRRLCESLNYKVKSLKRTHLGKLSLKDIPLGKYRTLTRQDKEKLFSSETQLKQHI